MQTLNARHAANRANAVRDLDATACRLWPNRPYRVTGDLIRNDDETWRELVAATGRTRIPSDSTRNDVADLVAIGGKDDPDRCPADAAPPVDGDPFEGLF